jgi:hypothetical protein
MILKVTDHAASSRSNNQFFSEKVVTMTETEKDAVQDLRTAKFAPGENQYLNEKRNNEKDRNENRRNPKSK